MQGLGGGSIAISRGNLRIGHESLHQGLQIRVPERSDEIDQRLPEFIDIPSRLGKVIGEFDLRFGQLAQLVDSELETVFVLLTSPLTLRKSSCSKALSTSSTLSHILASRCPLRSPRVNAR